MPFDRYEWVAHEEILTFEEITRLAGIFLDLGVRAIRITGGEPLVRANVDRLVGMLAGLDGLEDLSMTTNGSLLVGKAEALKSAGLRRLNVSFDTVDAETFRSITQRGALETVLDGLEAARACGLMPIKINTVVERGVNDHQILDMVAFARHRGFGLRFIEYMDAGNANRWQLEKLVPKREILEIIRQRHPLRAIERERGSAPAQEYRFEDGSGEVGIIASVTEPFCGDCTRARLTAEGRLVTCLFAGTGTDLKRLLREGAADAAIRAAIEAVWKHRTDRFSEERLTAFRSGDGYAPEEHRKIEMIRLGG